MTPDQISLIRSSFARAQYDGDALGTLFYERLFTIAPQLKPLFKGDIKVQGRKLMDTLAVAVSALRDMPKLTATLQDLGHRHRAYGVQPAHYAKVGEALIWTLERGLGAAFDAPTRAAWLHLYGVVCATMEPYVAGKNAA